MDRRYSGGNRGRKNSTRRGRGILGGSKVRYEIKASCDENKKIYTVLNISANKTLDDLCGMILDAFDFTHEHLYLFNFGGRGYGEGENIYSPAPEFGNQGTDITLGSLNLSPEQKFYLLYDFGDEWGFEIQIQNIYETEEPVIDGIVSVKGKLEQYPRYSEGGSGFEENGRENDRWDNDEWDGEVLMHFKLDPSLTVQDILETMDEEDIRLFAASFLDREKRSDCLTEKKINWVQKQYAREILRDKERLILFMKGKAAEMFLFLMTAKLDEESMELDPADMLDMVALENVQDLEEMSISLLHLYSLGICMPEMDPQGQIRSFSVSMEARRAYGAWLSQSEVRGRIRMYGELEKFVSVLVCRYGVIEVDRLQQLCRDHLGCRMSSSDFIRFLEGRLEYFGSFYINTEEESGTQYLSVFETEHMKRILYLRTKCQGLDYHPYDMEEISHFTLGNPYADVESYMELLDALWKSVQDMQVMGDLIRTVTNMCLMEMDPDMIIQVIRSVLNENGKRMTKKLQNMIRQTADNMPLGTRYGYTRNELEQMKM